MMTLTYQNLISIVGRVELSARQSNTLNLMPFSN